MKISEITTIIATVAAALSALMSLIGNLISIHYNRKTYRGNLEINRKLNTIDTIKKLIPKYLANVEYLCYVYGKACSNRNDGKGQGSTTFEDYDRQMDKAKTIRKQLELDLKIANNTEVLVLDIESIWKVIDDLGRYFNTSTNSYLSDKEKEFNKNFKKLSDLLMDDCISWYQSEFNKLIN